MGKSPKNRKSGGRVTEKGTRPKPSPSSKKKRTEGDASANNVNPNPNPKFNSTKKQDHHHPEKSWKNRPL